MQQQLQRIDERPKADSQRVRTVVETLASLRNSTETVAEVAHDARNMVTALGLYCDLLEEPGVLTAPFAHYGGELRLVASASRRLVEKLVALEVNREVANREGERSVGASVLLSAGARPATSSQQLPIQSPVQPPGKFPVQSALPARASAASSAQLSAASSAPLPAQQSNYMPNVPALRSIAATGREWELAPALPLNNLAAELMANRNLLSALAGPSIILTTAVEGGAQPVRLTGEDLTRVLINLVKNACEAMPEGGRIRIALGEQTADSGHTLLLTVEDSGPGIPEEHLDMIFVSGYTAHPAGRGTQAPDNDRPAKGSWPSTHRGLGLAITRSIIEASGGRISASNTNPRGARFTIQLPVAHP
jgi:signal transduction histidine kinase